jgi:hypothetical protein
MDSFIQAYPVTGYTPKKKNNKQNKTKSKKEREKT